jgi:hypothetical protein
MVVLYVCEKRWRARFYPFFFPFEFDAGRYIKVAWPFSAAVASQMPLLVQMYGGHDMIPQEIRKRGSVAHMA